MVEKHIRRSGRGSGVKGQDAGRKAAGQPLTERHGNTLLSGKAFKCLSLPPRRGAGPGSARLNNDAIAKLFWSKLGIQKRAWLNQTRCVYLIAQTLKSDPKTRP